MRVVCAWCTSVLSEGRGLVSHGICDSCSALFERAYLRAQGPQRRRGRPVGNRAGAPLPGFEWEWPTAPLGQRPGGRDERAEALGRAVR
jgi:hypothetical protein